jgi:hypothetical protein
MSSERPDAVTLQRAFVRYSIYTRFYFMLPLHGVTNSNQNFNDLDLIGMIRVTF